MNKDSKIERLFNQSINTKKDCIEQGFQPLYSMGDYITHSIQRWKNNVMW